MTFCVFRLIAMELRKPKLPMDMEYQGKDNDDVTAEGEDPLDWNQKCCWNMLR